MAVLEVAVWIARRRDTVLAVRAIDQRAFFLPGGIIEPGESALDAVVREVHEEIGHRIVPDALGVVGTVEAEAHGRPGDRVRLHCFRGGDLPGRVQADPEEIAEIRWIEPHQTSLFARPVRLALAEFLGAQWA